MVENNISDFSVLYALYNFIWGLKLFKSRDAKFHSPDKIGRLINVYNKNEVANIKRYSQNYTVRQLNRGVNAIVNADINIKTRTTDKMSNLLTTIHNILEA